MRNIMGRMIWLSICLGAVWCTESGARSAAPAGLEGRIAAADTTHPSADTHPLGTVTVYLFDLDQSRPFQELQHRCREATANLAPTKGSPSAVNDICIKALSEAVTVVPRLPFTASTRTADDGSYQFPDVMPGRRYQIVAVKMEAGEPAVMAALTPKLKGGKHLTIDLRKNDPWTNADPHSRSVNDALSTGDDPTEMSPLCTRVSSTPCQHHIVKVTQSITDCSTVPSAPPPH